VAPPPEEVVSAHTDYITGVARWDGRLIILLDLDKALLPKE
jgi:chemotaxis signal transduction protein